jgi:hypothetical protein
MKKIFIIVITMMSQFVLAQEDSGFSNNEYERIYIEAGFIQPIGKLSDQFEMSPSFGFWFRTKMNLDDYIDFGFNFFVPKNPEDANFKYQDSIVKYTSEKFGINIGTRFGKVIPLFKKGWNAEWNSGIGLALDFYKAPDELVFEDGEHTKEVLTTFYLSQGIKLNYKNIGLQCHYQWSPYELFNTKIEKGFGSQSLLFGIVYRQ